MNETQAYFLGLMYAKGDIIVCNNNMVRFKINIKFRRPNDESIRKDNKYTKISKHRGGKEKLASRFFDDINSIVDLLKQEFNIQFDTSIDKNADNWNKKMISVTSEEISSTNPFFTSLFCVDKIDAKTLQGFPYELKLKDNKLFSLSFIQGVCDASCLIPNEASSQNGGNGNPRIQIEPNQDRWELCIGLCQLFQEGLNIRVNNINWGHPEIRNKWKGQNHQFRVNLSDIPSNIQLYRLKYKHEEYQNLYERCGVQYKPNCYLCPFNKKGVKENSEYLINSSNAEDLNSNILDNRLKGVSVNVQGKKSLIVCYLLGCERCRKFIKVKMKQD